MRCGIFNVKFVVHNQDYCPHEGKEIENWFKSLFVAVVSFIDKG